MSVTVWDFLTLVPGPLVVAPPRAVFPAISTALWSQNGRGAYGERGEERSGENGEQAFY